VRKLLVLVVSLVAGLGAAQAFAHQSRAQGPVCGPLPGGVNVMTKTLTCPSPGIVFTANGSTLDCKGYTLAASGAANFGIQAAAKIGITIKNCNVKGFAEDYDLIKVTKSTLTNDTANKGDSGFLVQNSFTDTFRDNVATAGGRGFFLVTSSGNDFEDNAAVGNSTAGYDLEKQSTKNTFNDNLAINNIKVGFLVGAHGLTNLFTFDRAISNGSGIIVEPTANGNRFRDNAASGNAGLNCRDAGAGNVWGGNTGGPVSVPLAICP
jgi:parallel beta-helix repeat protein